MPPLPLLAPALLLALVALLLLVARRRRAEASGAAKPARETEEVRLLRLQVATLTEALQEARGQAPAVEAPATDAEIPAETKVDLAKHPVAGEAAEEPVVEEPVAEELWVPEPVLEPEAPAALAVAGADHTAHDYTDLSRSLAQAGRHREAALAQWAADLRVLGPLLEGRGAELCETVAALASADAGQAIVRAREAASALVGPEVAVTAMLADTSHLTAPVAVVPVTYPAADVSAEVLPDRVVRALETVLVTSADEAGDRSGASVGLRCDLVANVAPRHRAEDVVAVVRDVLEPHERPLFDDALGGGVAGQAS